MSTVGEILEVKGRNVWTISAERTVYAAIELMSEKNIGALVVSSDSSKLAGIISERDYARSVALSGKSSNCLLYTSDAADE